MNTSIPRKEFGAALADILQYWTRFTIDQQYGGFTGRVDNRNLPDEYAEKGSVLNARILWSFSAAANALSDPSYIPVARRAYEYIHHHFIDRIQGGVFWTVDHKGRPAQTKKQVYAQAFTIYACSEYFKVTGDTGARAVAIGLYELLERYSHDQEYGGYVEAFTADWQPLSDLRLSDKDENERKTMNTHLHVLEGYANLYTAWPQPSLRKRIRDILDIFYERIIDRQSGHLKLFFTDNWQAKGQTISFGHDIEASWLLLEAAEIIDDEEMISRFRQLAISMAEATLAGIDTDGGLWYESKEGHLVKEKHWWVQAEALVGFYSAYQLSGRDEFLQSMARNWAFTKKFIMDHVYGEWFWGIDADYTVMQEDKVGLWKCPYHNSRACLELIKRIQ